MEPEVFGSRPNLWQHLEKENLKIILPLRGWLEEKIQANLQKAHNL